MADINPSTDIILDIDVRYDDAIKKIAKYNQEIEGLRSSNKSMQAENKELLKQNKDLERQYQQGRISLQDLNQQLILNEDAIEANNQSIVANNVAIEQRNNSNRLLRREIQANIRVEREYEDSINSITAQLELLNRQYENMGAGKERDALGEEILSMQNHLNDLNEARGRFQGQVGSYRNAILETIGINGQFTQSLFEMSRTSQTGQGSLQSFFSNASSSAKTFGKTLLGLLSNPVFLAIAGIVGVGVAFKFWYDYNKGLEEATKLTKQFTNLSGNELKSYRNEVQGVADAFDKDFKEVLEASNAVAKQFGITQQEALNLIKDGFVAGADANGEYLETLKEYPAYFKEAGISASEFIAITAETAKQGIFSDKGVDAIKEANLRIREMTKSTAAALDGIGISSKQVQQDLQSGATTTFDVMQKVSEKLNELPESSSAVGTAIADIFGGPGEDAGLQYIQTLKDIDTNLDNVKKKTGELGEIQERQMNANIELQNVVAALFDQTGGTFETMIGNAKVFATESLTSIIRNLIYVINYFIEWYNQSENLRNSLHSMKFVIQSLWTILKEFFMFVVEGLGSIGEMVAGIFTLDWDRLNNATGKFFNDLAKRAINVGTQVKESFEEAKDKIQNSRINPIEIPVNLKTQDGNDLNTELAKMKSRFQAMNKKQLQAWINDEKNATSQYLSLAKQILEAKNKNAGVTDAMKKAAENEKKAALELAKFKLETEIKSQKDISDKQEKSYSERLNALNTYYKLQKAYILKDKEGQLSQTGLTASQKVLIEEKAKQKLLDLDKEFAESSLKLTKENDAKQLEVSKTNIQNRLAVAKQGSDAELALKLQQLQIQRDEEIKAAKKSGADILAIKMKYNALELQERQKQTDYLDQQKQKEFQNEIIQAQMNKQNTLALQIQAKQAEIAALKQLDTESDIDYLNRKLTLQSQLQKLEKDQIDYQVNTRVQALQAVSTIAGGIEELFSSMAEENEAFASFAKAMALFQIGIDTAAALTAGIRQAQSVPFPGNLVAIATTTATILANIAKAKKYLSSSKEPSYATGGLVSGPGSGTSDSISAKLSNGESVLTARATAMFSPVLSAFNQIGGGVPFSTQDSSSQIMGEDMLSRAFARAVQSLPGPVVSVQEINNVQNRIDVLESGRLG